MAITCPNCGAEFDATLFQFGHGVRCNCGQWVELDRGHVVEQDTRTANTRRESSDGNERPSRPKRS